MALIDIQPGIRRCSFGIGELNLTPALIAKLTTPEQLQALGRQVADIIDECEVNSNRYACKCPLQTLRQAITSTLKSPNYT